MVEAREQTHKDFSIDQAAQKVAEHYMAAVVKEMKRGFPRSRLEDFISGYSLKIEKQLIWEAAYCHGIMPSPKAIQKDLVQSSGKKQLVRSHSAKEVIAQVARKINPEVTVCELMQDQLLDDQFFYHGNGD